MIPSSRPLKGENIIGSATIFALLFFHLFTFKREDLHFYFDRGPKRQGIQHGDFSDVFKQGTEPLSPVHSSKSNVPPVNLHSPHGRVFIKVLSHTLCANRAGGRSFKIALSFPFPDH